MLVTSHWDLGTNKRSLSFPRFFFQLFFFTQLLLYIIWQCVSDVVCSPFSPCWIATERFIWDRLNVHFQVSGQKKRWPDARRNRSVTVLDVAAFGSAFLLVSTWKNLTFSPVFLRKHSGLISFERSAEILHFYATLGPNTRKRHQDGQGNAQPPPPSPKWSILFDLFIYWERNYRAAKAVLLFPAYITVAVLSKLSTCTSPFSFGRNIACGQAIGIKALPWAAAETGLLRTFHLNFSGSDPREHETGHLSARCTPVAVFTCPLLDSSSFQPWRSVHFTSLHFCSTHLLTCTCFV